MSIGSLRTEAYDRIRGKLALGLLTAGSELSEPRLAAMLGISRTPVREALQQLEVEGLVERTPRKSTIVRTPERRDILELFEIREALESHAAALAAERHAESDLERLRFLCGEMDRIAAEAEKSPEVRSGEAQARRLLAVELGFHLVLIQATSNRRLMKIVADAHVLSRVFGAPLGERSANEVRNVHRVHRDILQAIERSNVEKARELMASHIRQALSDALAHHDGQPRGNAPERANSELELPDYLLSEFKRLGLPARQIIGEKPADSD